MTTPATTETYTDSEAAVKAWLDTFKNAMASTGGVALLSAGGQYAPLRSGTEATYVVPTEIGGAPDSSDAPIDNPRMNLVVYGPTKAITAHIKQVLTAQLAGLVQRVRFSPDTVCCGALVESSRYTPDNVTNAPRYTLQVLFVLVAM